MGKKLPTGLRATSRKEVWHTSPKIEKNTVLSPFTPLQRILCSIAIIEARFSLRGILRRDVIDRHAEDVVEEFDVRTPSIAVAASSLSGGNKQKLIVGREFSDDIELLIAAQPTRGIDIGAIEFIHRRILEQRDKGAAVLLVLLN